MAHWIDNADSWICSMCGYESNNPNKEKYGSNRCPSCGEVMKSEEYVSIVRCRDCAVPHNRYTGCPKLNGLVTPSDFFCAFGRTE